MERKDGPVSRIHRKNIDNPECDPRQGIRPGQHVHLLPASISPGLEFYHPEHGWVSHAVVPRCDHLLKLLQHVPIRESDPDIHNDGLVATE